MLSLFLKKTTHFLSHETSTLSTKVIQSSSPNAVISLAGLGMSDEKTQWIND